MGFFSSIGDFVSNAWNGVKDVVGGVVDTVSPILGSTGDVVSGILGNNSRSDVNASNQAFAREQFQFNKDYIQNQLQWRIADAKKAGIHPLAAIGIQSPGFSSVSSSTTPLDFSWIGDLGQSANYGATKAKSTPEQQQMVNLQIRGMELDNEYKQAQIDQMKVDTLASTIASNQAFRSPSAPEVNANEPTSKFPSNKSFSDGTSPLLGLSRVGNTLISHINPDISDALTEDMIRNILANATAEMQSGRLSPEVAEHFSKDEIDAIRRGDAEIVYQFPSRWTFLWKPHMRPKYSDDGRSVSGKIVRGRL